MFKKVISLVMALSMVLGLTAWAGAAAPADKSDPAYFTDTAKIGSWAYEAVQWACGAALLETEGCGMIDPAGNTKRCEFAAAITRFMENVAG